MGKVFHAALTLTFLFRELYKPIPLSLLLGVTHFIPGVIIRPPWTATVSVLMEIGEDRLVEGVGHAIFPFDETIIPG
jgi:hypothetical protein